MNERAIMRQKVSVLFQVNMVSGIGSGQVFPLGDGGEVTEAPTEIPDTPPVCITEIDASFHWDSSPGYVYVFAGAWYYRYEHIYVCVF